MSALAPNGKIYTDDQRRDAVAHYILKGTFREVEEATGIPRSTVHGWTKQEWWEEVYNLAQAEISHKFKGRCHQIIDKATEGIIDRIENGNEVNTKDGIVRMKVSAGELAKVGGIYYDKLRISEGLPTSITDNGGYKKAMQGLAAEFKRLSEQNRNVVAVQESGESGIEDGEA